MYLVIIPRGPINQKSRTLQGTKAFYAKICEAYRVCGFRSVTFFLLFCIFGHCCCCCSIFSVTLSSATKLKQTKTHTINFVSSHSVFFGFWYITEKLMRYYIGIWCTTFFSLFLQLVSHFDVCNVYIWFSFFTVSFLLVLRMCLCNVLRKLIFASRYLLFLPLWCVCYCLHYAVAAKYIYFHGYFDFDFIFFLVLLLPVSMVAN